MGLLDRLFRREKIDSQPEYKNAQSETNKTSESYMKFSDTGKTYLKIDYKSNDYGKLDDATRLVVDTTPIEMPNGQKIYEAVVFWYNEENCVRLDENGREWYHEEKAVEMMNGKEFEFHTGGAKIKLGIDFNRLNDREYQKILMEQLLEQTRVQKYLNNGLKENPDMECGNYIGEIGINKDTGRYQKTFNPTIGKIVHNSKEQIEARNSYQEDLRMRRDFEIKQQQDIISRAQAEIKKLQNEGR